MPFLKLHSVSSARASSKDGEALLSEGLPTSRYLLFFCLATVGCSLDLLTKYWVFSWRGLPRPDNEWWLWEPYFGVETALNPGALFGMGAGNGGFFAALSIIAMVAILSWLFWAGAARDWRLTLALGCVMGGILGNLYDRLNLWDQPAELPLRFRSSVRDWILIRYGDFTWPNFNVADSLLVCGALMLLLHAFMREPNAVNSRSTESCSMTKTA